MRYILALYDVLTIKRNSVWGKKMGTHKSAKKHSVANEVDQEFLDYCREQLFGKNRRLEPGERRLVTLFWDNFKKKDLKNVVKGGRWLMLMLVDISHFAVLEQAMIQSTLSDEEWRLWFQEDYVDNFVDSLEDVARKAFRDYKAQKKGRRNIGVLCMKYDNMYPDLDLEQQKRTRDDLRKMLNKMLHAEQNKNLDPKK